MRRAPFDLAPERALAAELGVPPADIAGIDEVGRGPLAGPVTAGAAMVDPDRVSADLLALLDDSKKLSQARREQAAAAIEAAAAEGAVVFALGWASVEEIGRLNILQAALLAMRRAAAALPRPAAAAIVDGIRDPGLGVPARPTPKADALCASVAAAAILAKQARDAEMRRLDARYPGYGWAENAGYPTAAHRAALVRLGPTPAHRPGFKGVSPR
mgnify:CR=1 FL=1